MDGAVPEGVVLMARSSHDGWRRLAARLATHWPHSPEEPMTQLRSLRLAVPATLLSLALGATPALAFQPSVLVIPYPDSQTGNITDLAARGPAVAFTTDILVGGQRHIGLAASTDGG